jgi:hypothetical protein
VPCLGEDAKLVPLVHSLENVMRMLTAEVVVTL